MWPLVIMKPNFKLFNQSKKKIYSYSSSEVETSTESRSSRQARTITKRLDSQGFTFIELILYTALIAVFLTGAVYFAWDVIYAQTKSTVEQEVIENARFALQRIQTEIRNADEILNLSPSSLELDSGSLGLTTIFLEAGVIKINQGGTISALTNTQVEATGLSFVNHSTSDNKSKNIEFSLTIKHKNPEQKKEWEKTVIFNSSAEIRSN